MDLRLTFVLANEFKEGDLLVGGVDDDQVRNEARRSLGALRLSEIVPAAFVDDGVTEYDAHSDEYIPIEEQRAAKDDRWKASIAGEWEDGVDPEEFQARVVAAIDAIAAHSAGRRVAVIAHGGVINVYLAHVLGLPNRLWFHPEYTSVSRVLAAQSGLRSVSSLNETAHLFATHDHAIPGGAL